MNLTQVPISMIDTVAGDAGKVLTSDGSTLSWSSNRIAKAWVNFNGSTSVIRSSYNVSSVTKGGTGQYSVNFTSAMSDTNYCVVKTDSLRNVGEINNISSSSTFSLVTRNVDGPTTPTDVTTCHCIVFGN